MDKNSIDFTFLTPDFTKSVKDTSEERIITGYASTTDQDRQGEVVTLEAMKKAVNALLSTNSTVFYEHKHEQNPVGRILEAKVDEKGLWIKVLISSTANEIWTLIKEGILNKFSIGGKVKNYYKKFDKSLGKDITYITEMELYEVSVVGLPANASATFKAKSFQDVVLKAIEGKEKLESKLQKLIKKEGEEMEVKKNEEVITTTVSPVTVTTSESLQTIVATTTEGTQEVVVDVTKSEEAKPLGNLTKEDVEALMEKKEVKEIKKDTVEMDDPTGGKPKEDEDLYADDPLVKAVADLQTTVNTVLETVKTLTDSVKAYWEALEAKGVKTPEEGTEKKTEVEVKKSITIEEVTEVIKKTLDEKIGRIRLVPSRKGTIIKTDIDLTDETEVDTNDLRTLLDEERFKKLSPEQQKELKFKGLLSVIKGSTK